MILLRRALTTLLALSLLTALHAHAGSAPGAPGELSERQALHLLNRLGYGPAPGEVARVRAAGLHAWIDSQLAPPSPGSPLDARLRELAGPGAPPHEAHLLRAIASPRQLDEVLTGFWLSWFGIAQDQDADAIRAHVLGRYAALRSAAAHHPAMQGKPVAPEREALRALAGYFVSKPSAALMRSLARTWDATRGDQRAVLRVLFTSREFLAPAEHNSKQKDALRFVVSAVRASGVTVENAAPLAAILQRPMGAPQRTDFVQQLAQGRLPLAMAPPRAHRQASSAPPMRASVGADPAQGTVTQPRPVLMEAPSPSARAMAAAARSQPVHPNQLLELLGSDAFLRY